MWFRQHRRSAAQIGGGVYRYPRLPSVGAGYPQHRHSVARRLTFTHTNLHKDNITRSAAQIGGGVSGYPRLPSVGAGYPQHRHSVARRLTFTHTNLHKDDIAAPRLRLEGESTYARGSLRSARVIHNIATPWLGGSHLTVGQPIWDVVEWECSQGLRRSGL